MVPLWTVSDVPDWLKEETTKEREGRKKFARPEMHISSKHRIQRVLCSHSKRVWLRYHQIQFPKHHCEISFLWYCQDCFFFSLIRYLLCNRINQMTSSRRETERHPQPQERCSFTCLSWMSQLISAQKGSRQYNSQMNVSSKVTFGSIFPLGPEIHDDWELIVLFGIRIFCQEENTSLKKHTFF